MVLRPQNDCQEQKFREELSVPAKIEVGFFILVRILIT
jgi:hypothetical protein